LDFLLDNKLLKFNYLNLIFLIHYIFMHIYFEHILKSLQITLKYHLKIKINPHLKHYVMKLKFIYISYLFWGAHHVSDGDIKWGPYIKMYSHMGIWPQDRVLTTYNSQPLELSHQAMLSFIFGFFFLTWNQHVLSFLYLIYIFFRDDMCHVALQTWHISLTWVVGSASLSQLHFLLIVNCRRCLFTH